MKILEKKSTDPIMCPFCDSRLNGSRLKPVSRVCPHTLMVTDDKETWFERDDLSVDSLQEQSFAGWGGGKQVDSQVVMIETYGPAPTFFGAYYLFKG